VAIGRMHMRLSLLSAMVVAGLLSLPARHEAAAAPVTTAAPRIIPTESGNSVEEIYYHRGRYYPYYYRGGYYPYAYRGQYSHYLYYRYGRWHYY
jgi:hypothetical protein